MKPSRSLYIFCAGIVFALVTSGCKSYYVAPSFDRLTTEHRTVAILPFEMHFTGIKPENLTEKDLTLIAEAESQAFMTSFFDEILASTHRGQDGLRVTIQHVDKSMKQIEKNDMDIRSSWKSDPGELATLLGVDAVVKARIEKRRLISDLESYGIEVGTRILNVLSNYRVAPWLPYNASKAKEVRCSYYLIDTSGTVLWSINYDVDADWRQSANDIIRHINKKAAHHFPYR